MNVTVDFPAGTVTVGGTVTAEEFELVSVTFAPPAGAIPVRVMVPVTTTLPLPWNVLGDTVTEASTDG